MTDALYGYLSLGVAVFFYGTCYVPTKKYPTYDGIIFQWFMCSGILMVGLAWGLVSNDWGQYAQAGLYAFPEGILGGSLFAIANLLIPTVVNNVGLGVGFMFWNATNISFGYLISRFGLFGVEKTIPTHQMLSVIGILFIIGSIGVYGMIQPTLVEQPNDRSYTTKIESSPLLPTTKDDGYRSTIAKVIQRASPSNSGDDYDNGVTSADESLQEALMHPELPNFGPYMLRADASSVHVPLIDANAEFSRKLIGMLIALLVGAFLCSCLIPYTNWQRKCHPSVPGVTNTSGVISTCNPLNFVFSQCLGIYITSTIAFLIYSAFHRFVLKRSMPRSVMRPAYMCGVLWGIGLGGQLYSFGVLGFDQAFPLSSIGPAMVSMLWSACYFKEIQGKKNLQILSVATAMVFIGTALRVVSK